jgi:hypothetical protein
MPGRYIVTGSRGGHSSIPAEPFDTERKALIRAGELFDQYGSAITLEICLSDRRPPLRAIDWMMKWNLDGRPLPPEG